MQHLGSNWQSIVNVFRGPSYIIAALVVIGLIIAIWRYARRHRADGAAGDRPGTAASYHNPGRRSGGCRP